MGNSVQVKTYSSTGAMQRDISRREQRGWTMRTQLATRDPGHVRVASTIWKAIFTGGLYFLFAGVSRTKSKETYTITWERDEFWDIDHY